MGKEERSRACGVWEIWSDYIQFLLESSSQERCASSTLSRGSSFKLSIKQATTTWDSDQQKMDALRKVYHRAVQIPLDNVQRLFIVILSHHGVQALAPETTKKSVEKKSGTFRFSTLLNRPKS